MPSRLHPTTGSPSLESTRGKDAVNALLELLNRRWVLRILWELRGDPLTFRDLQHACGQLSTSVLNVRLGELREALLVVHDPGRGYALSELGRDLLRAAEPLLRWAPRWAERRERAQASGPGASRRRSVSEGTGTRKAGA